jgi:putative chitinase
MVTVQQLMQIAGHNRPNATTSAIADAFNRFASRHGVTNSKRAAQFLANVSVETGGFTQLAESLNYSVDGLLKTFGRHRISEADAKRLGRTAMRRADQVGIANTIYGGAWGRKNLGNTQPGDGWDFRGSGPGQVTGRANFQRIAAETGLDVVNNPDMLRTADTGMQAALILWGKWGLNDMADKSLTTDIRKRWNGGDHGLAEVRAAYGRARLLDLQVPAAVVPPPKPTLVPAPVTPAVPKPTLWAALSKLFTRK